MYCGKKYRQNLWHITKMYLSYIWRLAEMTLLVSTGFAYPSTSQLGNLLIQVGFRCKALLQAASWSGSSASLFLLPHWTNGLTSVYPYGAAESENDKPHCTSKFQVSACITSANAPVTKVVQMANPIVSEVLHSGRVNVFWIVI